jgi:hypothetical protein
MWHEVYYFVHARMLDYIWPMVFWSSSRQVSVYVSKSGSVHMWKSSVFRKDWETTVGWRFCALFSHRVICRWILMSFQSDVWEQFTSALFLPSISLHSFNLARKKRWSKVLWKVQGGMAGVLQGCTLANFSWNLLDELSVLVPLSE